MTAATYSGHWACRVPSDCSAVKSALQQNSRKGDQVPWLHAGQGPLSRVVNWRCRPTPAVRASWVYVGDAAIAVCCVWNMNDCSLPCNSHSLEVEIRYLGNFGRFIVRLLC